MASAGITDFIFLSTEPVWATAWQLLTMTWHWRISQAPTLYGQFNNLDDTDYVLTALKKLGFDDVFEVSKGAEIVDRKSVV